MQPRTFAGALAVAVFSVSMAPVQAQTQAPTDPQIAHIAYTAGAIDVAAARQALSKSAEPEIRAFAETMARDHAAVNDQALALAKRLGITPEENPTSEALERQASETAARLAELNGAAFDKAYIANEIAFHQAVNSALSEMLIPNARNPELKSLLETGLKLFRAHEQHAEQIGQDRD
ncbi:MAG: DUF4142 domain-containing protein [Phenylobacterium sp.]|uniref:DUF4142 domain-containing protein n=1 Tax=Phenylobacterium sp. TaxID=1871053 RepID=UPI0025DB767B|nr:DUF4142 domain-containing protein [Phenylobacterium sp.]MBI1197899.1 DUF4142 domain-containing protein [Phenylobacterium sp.]